VPADAPLLAEVRAQCERGTSTTVRRMLTLLLERSDSPLRRLPEELCMHLARDYVRRVCADACFEEDARARLLAIADARIHAARRHWSARPRA